MKKAEWKQRARLYKESYHRLEEINEQNLRALDAERKHGAKLVEDITSLTGQLNEVRDELNAERLKVMKLELGIEGDPPPSDPRCGLTTYDPTKPFSNLIGGG